MRLIEHIAEFKEARRRISGSVGFVPTMGYLHDGHMALVKGARAENDTVIVSIFVNPTQFGPHEDYKSYPRDLKRDLALLERAGVELVFAPSAQEMYPSGYQTYVEVEGVTERLEGELRPGHFRGVATVVAKLFNIVEPARAYFGQKDAQQLLVIRKMVKDLNINVEVVAVPTVREPDSLAMSSRNTYLNSEERKAATVLWRALSLAKGLYSQGQRSAERLRLEMKTLVEKEPLARIDYVSVADTETLEELDNIDRPTLVSMAVRIGRTRLIDNITLGS